MESPGLEEQVAARLQEIRRARVEDTAAAPALAAYFRRRCDMLPEPLREETLARLGASLVGLSAERLADAERYARVRARLQGIADRLAALPPPTSIEARERIRTRAARQYRVISIAFLIAVIGGPIALVVGLLLGGDAGRTIATVGGVALLGAFRARGFLTMSESSAISTANRLAEADEDDHARRELEEMRATCLASEDARFVRALVARHPLLAFEGLPDDRRSAIPYRS